RLSYVLDEFPTVELMRGHVHRNTYAGPLISPRRGLAAGLSENPAADRHDQTNLLGHGDEAVREDDASRRVAPADQGLDADNLTALQVEYRLVEEEKLALLQRPAEVGFELQAI